LIKYETRNLTHVISPAEKFIKINLLVKGIFKVRTLEAIVFNSKNCNDIFMSMNLINFKITINISLQFFELKTMASKVLTLNIPFTSRLIFINFSAGLMTWVKFRVSYLINS
jgi:hypothetical protein